MAGPARRRRTLLPWLATGVGALVLAVLAFYFVNPFGTASGDPRARLLGFVPFRIASVSMAPTLVPGDIVLVDTKAFAARGPARGELVAYVPAHSSTAWIHRVVALPGERVEMRQGQLFVDGQRQPPPSGAALPVWPGPGRDMAPQTVPEGHVFLMGDNRDQSMDSRYTGPVPCTALVGLMLRVLR